MRQETKTMGASSDGFRLEPWRPDPVCLLGQPVSRAERAYQSDSMAAESAAAAALHACSSGTASAGNSR